MPAPDYKNPAQISMGFALKTARAILMPTSRLPAQSAKLNPMSPNDDAQEALKTDGARTLSSIFEERRCVLRVFEGALVRPGLQAYHRLSVGTMRERASRCE